MFLGWCKQVIYRRCQQTTHSIKKNWKEKMIKNSEYLIEKIIEALDNASYEVRYYFNKKTREVTYYTDFSEDLKKEEEDLDFTEWIEINGIESYKKYNLMKDFASRQHGELRERLVAALNGKGSFRRFKDVLYRFPNEQKKWYEFEHEWFKKKAIEFLDRIYEK